VSPKLKRIILITLIMVPLFFVALRIIALNSEPYENALAFLKNNEIIMSNIGDRTEFSLSFIGYSAQYSGASGKAEYEINAYGKKAKGKIFISLNKNLGIWSVLKSNLVLESGEIIEVQ
jgi:hypothetical protein